MDVKLHGITFIYENNEISKAHVAFQAKDVISDPEGNIILENSTLNGTLVLAKEDVEEYQEVFNSIAQRIKQRLAERLLRKEGV